MFNCYWKNLNFYYDCRRIASSWEMRERALCLCVMGLNSLLRKRVSTAERDDESGIQTAFSTRCISEFPWLTMKARKKTFFESSSDIYHAIEWSSLENRFVCHWKDEKLREKFSALHMTNEELPKRQYLAHSLLLTFLFSTRNIVFYACSLKQIMMTFLMPARIWKLSWEGFDFRKKLSGKVSDITS